MIQQSNIIKYMQILKKRLHIILMIIFKGKNIPKTNTKKGNNNDNIMTN